MCNIVGTLPGSDCRVEWPGGWPPFHRFAEGSFLSAGGIEVANSGTHFKGFLRHYFGEEDTGLTVAEAMLRTVSLSLHSWA